MEGEEVLVVTIRLWVEGVMVDTAIVYGTYEAHGAAFEVFMHRNYEVVSTKLHMIELEFMNETDPAERVQRWGNDPSMMTEPTQYRPGQYFDAAAPPKKFVN